MPNLSPNILIVCASKIALPAITAMHQQKVNMQVACYTLNIEFEQELQYVTRHLNIPLTIFSKQEWKEQLETLLQQFKPDVVFVKTFGLKIPMHLCNIPKWGFINFHYALLPQYRGAFPLFQVLKNQDAYGGVTVHHISNELDKGALIMQQYVPIKFGETYGKHEMNLANEGAKLTMALLSMLDDIDAVLPAIPQNEEQAQTISKPKTNDLIIDWHKMSAKQIVSMIQATNPWGKGALAYWMNIPVQLLFARYDATSQANATPGEIIELSEEKGMRVACINNESIWIDVIYLQEGYLPGFKLKDMGLRLGAIAMVPKIDS